jgi:hypothetical protein
MSGTNIVSLKRIEDLLGRGRVDLRALADRGSLAYGPFHLVNGTKDRHIDNPDHDLKVVQHRIERRILSMWTPPGGMLGGVRGATIADNARIHAGSRWVVKTDIASYFPSVDNRLVYTAIRRLVGCREVAELLTRLTTVNYHLPHGAPTSTTLANMIMEPAFLEISRRAGRIGVSVSCWVDDYVFSGERAREAINIAYDVLGRLGLRLSRKKTRMMRTDRVAQEATGVVLNGGVSLGRERFRAIRQMIRAAKHTPPTEHQLLVIRGKLAFAAMVNERQAAALVRQAAGLPEHGAPGGKPPSPFHWEPCPPTCRLGRGMVRHEHPRAA